MEVDDAVTIVDHRNLILENLKPVEQGVKLKKDSVRSTIQTWEILSNIEQDFLSRYLDLLPRIVKALARTIFSSPWFKLSKEYGTPLLGLVMKLKAHFESLNLMQELAQLDTIIFLLQNNAWQHPGLDRIIRTQEEINNETVDGLWKVEGWIFIESRIESLCVSDAGHPVLRLGEAFLFKGKQFLESDCIKNQDSQAQPKPFDLTMEKYIQTAAVIAIYVTDKIQRNPDNEDFSYQIFVTHFDSNYFIQLISYLSELEAIFQPKCLAEWEPWGLRNDAAFNLLDLEIEHIMENPDLSFQYLNFWMTIWVKLTIHNCKTKSKREDDPSCSIDEFIPDRVNHILKKVYNDVFAFQLAETLVEIEKDSKKLKFQCIETYLQRLEPIVEQLVNTRDIGDKDAEIEISQKLAPTFLLLSKHINTSVQIYFEVMLTVFSLNPTAENLNTLCNLYESNSDSIQINGRLTRTYNLQLALPDPLYMKLTSIIETVRVSRLSAFRENWEKLKEKLHRHLETLGKDIKTVNELQLAKPTDFSIFEGLKPAFDEDDTGYEVGFDIPNTGTDIEEAEDLEEEEEVEIKDDGKKKKKKKKKKLVLKEPNHRMRHLLKSKQLISGSTLSLRNIKKKTSIKSEGEIAQPKRKYVRKLEFLGSSSKSGRRSNKVPLPNHKPRRKPGRPSIFESNCGKSWPPLRLCHLKGNLQYYPIPLPNFPRAFCSNPSLRSLDTYFAFPSTYASVCRPRLMKVITNAELLENASKSGYSPSFFEDILNAPVLLSNRDYSDDPQDWFDYGMTLVENKDSTKLVPPKIETEKSLEKRPKTDSNSQTKPNIRELPKTNTSDEKEPLIVLRDIAERIVYNGKTNPLTPPGPDPELLLSGNKRAVVKLHDVVKDGSIEMDNEKVKFWSSRNASIASSGKSLPSSVKVRTKATRKRKLELSNEDKFLYTSEAKVHEGKLVSDVADCMNSMINQISNSKPLQLHPVPHKRSRFESNFLGSGTTTKHLKLQLEEQKCSKFHLIHPSECREVESYTSCFGEKFIPGPVYSKLKPQLKLKKMFVTPKSIRRCITEGLYKLPLKSFPEYS